GIAQSPPADWGMSAEDARAFARRCVEALGATPDTAAGALITAGANDIRRAVDKTSGKVLRERPGLFPIAPVVDGEYLTQSPIDAITSGAAHQVPLIIGTNRDEGTLFAKFADELPTTPSRMHALLTRAGGAELESRVIAAYPGYP